MRRSILLVLALAATWIHAGFPAWTQETPYKTRIDFVHSLGRNLSPSQTDGLLAYLSAPDPTLRPDREAALKNEVLNLLRAQEVLPTNFVSATIGIFRAREQPTAILDYCVQHLGAVAERIANPATLTDLRACLQDAAREHSQSYSGTALVSLTHTPGGGGSARTALLALTLSLASDPSAHPAARGTALQLAAEQGQREALPVVRTILADSSHPATLHISALAALGALGTAADLPLLDAFSSAYPNPRFRPALAAARARLEKSLPESTVNP